MKQLRFLFSFLLMASLAVLISCGDDEEEPTECNSGTFTGANVGTAASHATISFKNFTSDPNGDQTIDVNAAAGDNLSIAVEIVKGTARPQKLRVFQTDCDKLKGTAVKFEGQPKTNSAGDEIDLANTDDAQLRTVLYTVPTGMSTIYLNFEVDESNSNYAYKRMKITVSGSGIVDSYTNITLGGNTNANASRLSSGTGQTFTSCQTAANIDYIDITYGNDLTTGNKGYLLSNPARYDDFTGSPIGSTATTATKSGGGACGDEAASEYSVRGGEATYFKLHTANDFATIDDAGLSALTVSSTNNQYVEITTTPQVFEFLTASGRKGLVRVNSGTLTTAGSINVDVKVQR
jgi:hypothetical protein